MLDEVAVFAVYGYEVVGLDERVDELQFLAAGMSGDMDVRDVVVQHVDAALVQLVDDVGNRLFVAGDRRRGEHDQIVRPERNLRMAAERHPIERAHRLALAAGGDEGKLAGLVALHVRHVDHQAVGDVHIAQPRGGREDVEHAPPRNGDLAPVFGGGVDDLLHAVNVGGKGRHDHPLFVAHKDAVERGGDDFFGRRVAGALRVGRIAQQQPHALRPQLGKARQVDRLAV